MALADFPRAASLGFEAGRGRAVPSAVHLLVKGILAERENLLQRKFELEKEQIGFGRDVALTALRKGKTPEETELIKARTGKEKALTEKARRGKAPTDKKITATDIKTLGEIGLAKQKRSVGQKLFDFISGKVPFTKQTERAKAREKFGRVSPEILQQFQTQFQTKGADFFKSSNVIEYTPEEEKLIADNMRAHNRSREEVIERLQALGHLQ